ncbi:MAG: LytR/AlgR family response regulator transcription factor [Streptococcus sp.]
MYYGKGFALTVFLDIATDSDIEGEYWLLNRFVSRDPYASIVFITAHPELLPSTFQYRLAALDFIDKNLPDIEYEDRIISDIGLALSKNGLSQIECAFTIDTKNATIQVPFHKILYFETSPTVHKVILHTTEEQIEFYGQLSKVVKQDCRLYKCHKSFVVNPENIVRLDKELGVIYFENGSHAWFQS